MMYDYCRHCYERIVRRREDEQLAVIGYAINQGLYGDPTVCNKNPDKVHEIR